MRKEKGSAGETEKEERKEEAERQRARRSSSFSNYEICVTKMS